MSVNRITTKIAVVNGGSPSINLNDVVEEYILTGVATLTSSWNVASTGTVENGMNIIFKNKSTVTLGGNHVSILGKQIPDEYSQKKYTAILSRIEGSWELFINPSFDESGIITYDSLDLTGSILNADVDPAAGIVYSKLNLAASIVNADIATGAAIVYSKLSLAGSILNADIAAGAAIAYSKLNLSGSIVNADIAAGAAIAYSKLSLAGSITNADLAGSIAYSKLSLTGQILNADLAGSIDLSKLAVSASPSEIIGSDVTGALVATGVGTDKLSYISTLTSDAQVQITALSDKATPEVTYLETGTYTLTSSHKVILMDTSGGDIIVNFPKASTIGRIIYEFLTVDGTGAVTLNVYAGDDFSIDGARVATVDMGTTGDKLRIVSDGVDTWFNLQGGV